jgi:hypothetical protein
MNLVTDPPYSSPRKVGTMLGIEAAFGVLRPKYRDTRPLLGIAPWYTPYLGNWGYCKGAHQANGIPVPMLTARR